MQGLSARQQRRSNECAGFDPCRGTKGEEAHDEAKDQLADRAARLEEDGQADDRELAHRLDDLKVVRAQLVAEDELLHIIGKLRAQPYHLLLHPPYPRLDNGRIGIAWDRSLRVGQVRG